MPLTFFRSAAYPRCVVVGAIVLLGQGLVAEEITTLDPVEVAAKRVTDPLVVIPYAATTYDGDFLKTYGVGNYEEVAPLVPGFFVSAQSVDSVSLNIRGLNSDTSDPKVLPRVSVFQDGVPINNVHGNNVALFDMADVEVYKGPQATTFGRGVQSGALDLASKRPGPVTGGALTVGAGDYNARSLDAFVNGPVAGETLLARFAVYANRRDGYVKNLADGSDLQGENTLAARASLRWQPSTATTADLILNHQRDDTPGVDFKSAVIPVAPGSTDTDAYTAANLNRGSELGVTRTITGLTGILRHELNDDWTITSTSSWREVESQNEFDGDGSYLYLLEVGELFRGRQIGQQLRIEYDRGDRMSASLGANVSWETGNQTTLIRTDENTLWGFFTNTAPPFPLNPRYAERNRNKAETTGGDLFGRVDYKLTDKLTVGGGLRGTQERIGSRYQSFLADTPTTLPVPLLPTAGGGNAIFKVSNGELENRAEERSWAGQVDARYVVTPTFTVYSSMSRGRRPSILDFDPITLAPDRHREETVWNYEAGLKGATAGRRVRYDASVFQYYFDHFQTQRVSSLGVVENFDGGRARGQGLEVSAQGDVTRELTLFANYGFTDAAFSARDADGNAQVLAGDTFRLTARHVVSVGGTLSLAGPKGGTVFFTPLYTYRSAYYFEDDNSQNGGSLRQKGFGVVNLRLGYRAKDERWEVVGYVNNVFDQEYLIDSGNIGGGYNIPTRIPAAPRLAGVSATVRF